MVILVKEKKVNVKAHTKLIMEFGQICLCLQDATYLLLKREIHTVFTDTHTLINPQPNYTQYYSHKIFSLEFLSFFSLLNVTHLAWNVGYFMLLKPLL